MDGDAEPSAASGGCSEAEHPQRSKKSSKRVARRFFQAPQGGGGRCACGYLGSVSVRSTDLDFSFKKNLNSYPALQATERGSSRGKLSPLTVFWFLLYAQKERLRGERCLLCLCKRLRDADRRLQIWPKISFTAFHGRKAGPAGRRILLCGEGRAQAGEGDLREVVAGLAGRAIQVHAVNGDLLPAGQGAKGGAALQVIQKG